MKAIITFILLLTAIISSAANKTKNWSDGPLSWDDFKGVTVIEGVPSFLKTTLNVESKQESTKGKLKYKVAAIAKIDSDRSFANKEQRTEQRLRYHQLQFDLLELFRRRLQTELNTGMTGPEADSRLKQYQAQFQAKIDEITINTDNGARDPRIQDYEYYVRKNLEELALPQIYEITPDDWTYGFLLGTGAISPVSSIKNAFSSAWTFTAGLNVGFKRLKLSTDISYSQPKILNQNVFDVKDQRAIGTYATYLGISLSLGYTVVETKHFSMTPKAGAYWSSYSWNAGNFELNSEEEEVLKDAVDLSMNNFNWYAAIDFDYHFYTTVGKTPFFLTGNKEQYISSIRLTPFVGRAIYKNAMPELNGCQIGLTISYVGIARSLGLKH